MLEWQVSKELTLATKSTKLKVHKIIRFTTTNIKCYKSQSFKRQTLLRLTTAKNNSEELIEYVGYMTNLMNYVWDKWRCHVFRRVPAPRVVMIHELWLN